MKPRRKDTTLLKKNVHDGGTVVVTENEPEGHEFDGQNGGLDDDELIALFHDDEADPCDNSGLCGSETLSHNTTKT